MVETGATGRPGVDFSSITEDIIPSEDNTYDSGSENKRWALLYVVLAFVGSLTIGGIVNIAVVDQTLIINDSTNIHGNLDIDGWITSDNWTDVSITESQISDFGTYVDVAQTCYIGTTQVAINRASATLNLAGIGTLDCGALTSTGIDDNASSTALTLDNSQNATFTGNIKVGGFPYAVAHDEIQNRIFVTNQHDGTVSVISLADNKVIKTITVGDYPEGIALHPSGGSVYVTNWFDGTVNIIDTDTLEITGEIKTQDGSRAFGNFFSTH